ncbi:AVN_HP_G0099510.mRNA.1.CDS.1 [Saccharomyces cerevisiae]|nr:ANM_HP_G0136350.mRNA.1.CDS.1 [Saccharomyces cerevisiae]CAI4980240.1 ATV_HP_G0124120.mRNA.1.CDS.1 [Saccharomyces cerevisiae]CAI5020303.1 AVN_HP_G0061290.mRNA.1.CDS.1 [Saccharomyces cerevisiae]CAI5022413.1 BTE_HP_G0076910.mRNA.1.CDS.1 [Saccharomyces cerevisiae]CAI5054672.1 ANM_HP_G0200370.mRNA.1.CDS.1 [Saccharomyces cerevisiae]
MNLAEWECDMVAATARCGIDYSSDKTRNPVQSKQKMISDEQLNSLAITFGIVMMTLIVIYHAVDSTMSPKN